MSEPARDVGVFVTKVELVLSGPIRELNRGPALSLIALALLGGVLVTTRV